VTTALVAGETVLLAVLALFVVALLRSHAEILRRLESFEAPQLPRHGEAPTGTRSATDIDGRTPSGGARRIAMGAGRPDTLLAFLSSGCSACAGLVAELERGRPPLPDGMRLVVVTKDRSEERVRRFRGLEGRVDVVMSSPAWAAYGAPGSPYFVHVDGATGTVVGEGSAARWEQVVELLLDSLDDRGDVDASASPRIDAVLEAAGIGPGHPSLRPSTHADDGST
jgi:hypothetical protein